MSMIKEINDMLDIAIMQVDAMKAEIRQLKAERERLLKIIENLTEKK